MKVPLENLQIPPIYDLHETPRLMKRYGRIYFRKNILLLFRDVYLFYAHDGVLQRLRDVQNTPFHMYILLCRLNDIINHLSVINQQ